MIKLSTFIFSVLFSLNVLADDALARLNTFVSEVSTFEATFSQTVIGADGQIVDEASGLFQLARPGKFRWLYEQPFPQEIVADGEQIWFYDVDLEQVTVKSQNEALADTPASLLAGKVLPEDQYQIETIPSDDGLFWVTLIPKQVDTGFQVITLAFDEDSLRQMIMRDSFDQRTRLTFSQVKENVQLPADIFDFTPPEGVDVVGE
jgi:outer membrane lipoprotein carrier protein